MNHNQECIKKQVSKFLDFNSDAPNGAEMVNNYDWMKDFTFLDFARTVGKHITVNYMMAKDSVQQRLNGTARDGLSFTEFTYQLLQGYDFLHLYQEKNCKMQLGGNDQWGNMTTGTELIRRTLGNDQEAYALTCPLITKADGKKFGKTESGNIWLDRNRTSPFAFTGNRFEFRAAGSSANCAASMIVINAAMAHQLNEFKAQIDELVNGGMEQEEALYKVLKETIIASQNIRFEGDGYSEEWKAEAAQRGLTNICHVPEAILKFNDEQSRSVLIGEKVFNENELFCRIEVELEKFTKKVQIESRVLGDLAINHIVPTAVIYQNRLLENLRGLKEIFPAEEYEALTEDRKNLVREIQNRILAIKKAVHSMTEARKVANHLGSQVEKAFSYEEQVRPYLEEIRDHIDHLELEIDDEIWPLPKYRELLFTK